MTNRPGYCTHTEKEGGIKMQSETFITSLVFSMLSSASKTDKI